LIGTGITVTETADLDAVLNTTDVLYQTRVQKERFASLEEYEKSKGAYIITPATLSPAKKVRPPPQGFSTPQSLLLIAPRTCRACCCFIRSPASMRSPPTSTRTPGNDVHLHLPGTSCPADLHSSRCRAMYFKQPQYGMYMRMALLASVLGKEGPML